jgi:hypothetical protein
MIGFKQQAHRWTKGSFQTCIKLLPKVLRSKHLSRGIKVEAFFHLTNTVVYPLMVLLTVLMFPTFFNKLSPFEGKSWSQYVFSLSLFVLATCSSSFFFVFGQRELFGKEAGWKSIIYLPVLMALGVGVGLNNSVAVLQAIWGAIRKKPSEFVRTPKYGVTGKTRQTWARNSMDANAAAGEARDDASAGVLPQAPKFLTFRRLMLPILEIAFGCYMACCIYISVAMYMWYGDKASLASIPFLLIFAGGYFYVGMGSVYALWKMHLDAREELAEAAEIAGL